METLNKTTLVVSEFIIAGLDNVPHRKLVGGAILIILSLILLGSFTNISIITLNKPLHTPMYFFICSLAMVDILYTSSVSLTMLNVLLGENKKVPYGPCILQHFLFHLGSAMETFTIALMAYDRLIAISNPLRGLQFTMSEGNKSTVTEFVIVGFPGLQPEYYGLVSAVMFLVYVCTLLGNAIFLMLFTKDGSLHKPMYIIILNLVVSDILFSTATLPKIIARAPYGFPAFIFAMVVLLVPLAFIVFSYTSIIVAVLWIASTEGRLKMLSTCSAQLIIIALYYLPRCFVYLASNVGIKFSKDLRIVIIMLAQLIIIALYYLPRCFVYLASNVGIKFSKDLRIVIIMLYSLLPPMINPLIYCLRTREIKVSLMKIFKGENVDILLGVAWRTKTKARKY
ncbi:hypothetical protein SKAU_G00085210 [Synaphobranchus kaupii]|uniref:G-protein coupled receptors family 1 profile domain-containing protein n=1 Tax=Synaphobranchus kaupii TaxID=118154 RepID=A0A9Q1J5Z2_SYNKA|nr:hypothetical protein SKAU_G00085210 [Synaphobranchus kaupii]